VSTKQPTFVEQLKYKARSASLARMRALAACSAQQRRARRLLSETPHALPRRRG
jgi:hypothetical protein